MPLYECVFIARPDISSAQAEGLTDQFAKFVEDHGGSIQHREQWGLRTLAFRIRKNRKGHYALMNIDAPAPVVDELGRLMRLNEDVMRHLTVRVDELHNEPSPMMSARGGRGDDRERGDRDRDRPRRRDFGRDGPGPGGGRASETPATGETSAPNEETNQ